MRERTGAICTIKRYHSNLNASVEAGEVGLLVHVSVTFRRDTNEELVHVYSTLLSYSGEVGLLVHVNVTLLRDTGEALVHVYADLLNSPT